MMNLKKLSIFCSALVGFNVLAMNGASAEEFYQANIGQTYYETSVMQSFMTETVYANERPELLDASITMNGLEMNDMCTSFVRRDGTLGSNGRYLMDQLAGGEFNSVLNQNNLANICPGYNDLDLRKKSILWLMIMTAMAHFESSCDPTESADGPNGTAYGLYQLHKGSENDYGVRECALNASLSSTASIRCALGMLDNQMQKQGGKVFSYDSYWDVLRPSGKILNGRHKYEYIRDAVKNSPFCKIQHI
jgi:hypothetical protein